LRYIGIFKPDILHAHFAVPSGALAYTLSVLTGIPYILTAHLGDVPGGVPEKTDKWFRWIKPLTIPIWKRATSVVAVSEFTRTLALKNYPVDIQVIPNGVDVDSLAPADIKVNKPVQIVFAGRFMPQKNPVAIPHTLADIKDLDWHCYMLGDGPLLEEVKREIQKHALQDRFTLPGWVTPEDALQKFGQCDILFMPSLTEGLPVVGVQALAKGLALVVSDIGGFAGLVDNGVNGWKITPQDIAGFRAILRKLILDPQLLNSFRNASLKKSREFDIKLIAEKYSQILERAAHGE
jgi:glycosyltransferase involved in cell wall biosynthesis